MNFQQFKEQFQKVEVRNYPQKVAARPLVSVCVQTYNQAPFLRQCLEGILEQQTSFPYEILLAEDDSRDESRAICIEMAEKHPEKIRLFLHSRKNNIKVSEEATGNFPTLFNFFSSKGKYIAICEGDDYWTDPLKLQKQFSFMENNPDFSVCYHDFRIVGENNESGTALVATSLKKDLEAKDLIFPWQHPATLSIFFRNSFQEIPVEATRVINLDIFLYSLLGRKGKGKYLQAIKPAGYRIHSSGLWSSRSSEKKTLSRILTYRQLCSYYQRIAEPEVAKEFKKRNFKLYHSLLFAAVTSQQYKRALGFLHKYLVYRLR